MSDLGALETLGTAATLEVLADGSSRPKPPKLALCRNCGTPVPGRFCTNCGQGLHEESKAISRIVYEFIENIFNFDGRMANTLFALLLRPGKMTAEFNSGLRARYVPPVRLYLFVTLIFFLVLSSANVAIFVVELIPSADYDKDEAVSAPRIGAFIDRSARDRMGPADRQTPFAGPDTPPPPPVQPAELPEPAEPPEPDVSDPVEPSGGDSIDRMVEQRIAAAMASAGMPEPPATGQATGSAEVKRPRPGPPPKPKPPAIPGSDGVPVSVNVNLNDSGAGLNIDIPEIDGARLRFFVDLDSWHQPVKLDTRKTRESILADQELPNVVRRALLGFITSIDNPQGLNRIMGDNLAKALFVLMPVYGLLLALLYWRRRLYYVEHLNFSLHIHTLLFVLCLLVITAQELAGGHLDILEDPGTAVAFFLFTAAYVLLALKRVHGQGWFKTTVKWIILGSIYLSIMSLTLLGLLLISLPDV